MRRRATNYDETNVTTAWRHMYPYLQRAGAAAAIKRRMRRRERREGRRDTTLRHQEGGREQ